MKPMLKYTVPLPAWIVKEFRRAHGKEAREYMRRVLHNHALGLQTLKRLGRGQDKALSLRVAPTGSQEPQKAS